MVSIHDQHRQIEWEVQGVNEGVARYREAAEEADPMMLPPGKALIRGVVGPLMGAIAKKRDEAADGLSKRGAPPVWAWPLQTINPEKAAVVTLHQAVAAVSSVAKNQGVGGSSITLVAERIAECLRDQAAYDAWVAEEEARNAVAKRERSEGHKDRLKALKLTYPNLDRRVWTKWARKLEVASKAEWTTVEAIGLGSLLIGLLLEVAPDRFVREERPLNGGVQYSVGCTPAVREVMNDLKERAEVSRPRLMPMLCPPNPWCYGPEPGPA